MKSIIATVKSLSKIQILVVILLIAGLGLVVFFGVRSVRSFRQLQYIQEQGLFTATSSPDAVRSWMNIRFVATAYAIPEEYLFAELDLPLELRRSDDSLAQLNRVLQLGRSDQGDYPAIIDKVRDAIERYRKNPVSPGLEGDVRPWMSIQYIANSTGIPMEYIFEEIGLPMAGNEYKPLGQLSDEFRYGRHRGALVEAVQSALNQYGGGR